MKKIILIRHAKSSWSSGVSEDIDRPLNDRGKRDAPFMAQKLKEIVPKVDGLIKSPSKRTRQTATYFLDVFDLEEKVNLTARDLYHGSIKDILDEVQGLPMDWETVILFGHNPGMTYIAQYFGGENIPNMPTCGVLIVESEVNDWAELSKENSKILAFEYPKKYFV